MMKKMIFSTVKLLAMVSLLLSACQLSPRTTPVETELDHSQTTQVVNIKVLAVESFLTDIAQNVAGDRVQVETLMPLGMDPHAFEASPKDVAKITESQVLIVNGAGFEEWLAKTLENAGGERKVTEASAGLTSREAREGEEAVMSPEEKAESICFDLAEKSADVEIAAGSDAASAVELHGEEEHAHEGEAAEYEHEAELLLLKLNANDGGYAGFVKFDVAEDGEYVIAANDGTLAVADANGAEMDVEVTLPLVCAGLNGGILLGLEPGKYLIALSGLAAEKTPFFAGSAGSHHHHHEGDPHFWLDPLNVVKYVENIRDGLIAADPSGKDTYTQNAAAYIDQLNELDEWIKSQVSAIPEDRRLIVTNHESFGYFADRYGFKIIGTIIPSVSTGASPSAQQMSLLVDRIRETGTIAIFLETGSNPQLAEQIAAETGIKVVLELFTHSITDASGKAPTYLDMMKYNVQTIVEALK
jgi:ABC-type Zn uptake system ZnuABC Zn-binding protein ZnuA